MLITNIRSITVQKLTMPVILILLGLLPYFLLSLEILDYATLKLKVHRTNTHMSLKGPNKRNPYLKQSSLQVAKSMSLEMREMKER